MEEQVLSTSRGLFLQQISSHKARRARRLQSNLWSFQKVCASGSKSTAQLIRLSQKDTILLQSLQSKFQPNNISYGYCKRCVQSYRVVLLHKRWIWRQVLYKSSSQIPLKCICRSMYSNVGIKKMGKLFFSSNFLFPKKINQKQIKQMKVLSFFA